MTNETHRRRVVVTGVVQGVFFRSSTASMAHEAGVAGWVRNLSDGRVEAVFEGEPRAVEAAVMWCRTGPEHAVVERVDAVEEPPEGLRGFRVLA